MPGKQVRKGTLLAGRVIAFEPLANGTSPSFNKTDARSPARYVVEGRTMRNVCPVVPSYSCNPLTKGVR